MDNWLLLICLLASVPGFLIGCFLGHWLFHKFFLSSEDAGIAENMREHWKSQNSLEADWRG